MKKVTINITTDNEGAATAYGDAAVVGGGGVYAVDYLPGDISAGATVTLTDETGVSHTIWSKATAGSTAIRVYPRTLEQLGSNGSNLTTHDMPLASGRLKVVVSDGTDTGAEEANGTMIVHIAEL
jgi:hypothetical protein